MPARAADAKDRGSPDCSAALMALSAALGIADNQALTVLCENIATTPMILFPRINAAHARQPNWTKHLDALRSVGVDLVYGEDVWPLAEPRQAGPRELPWSAILAITKQYC